MWQGLSKQHWLGRQLWRLRELMDPDIPSSPSRNRLYQATQSRHSVAWPDAHSHTHLHSHLLTHLVTHTLTHSCTQTYTLTQRLIHLLTYTQLTHTFTQTLICSLDGSLTHLHTHSFTPGAKTKLQTRPPGQSQNNSFPSYH